MTDAIFEKTKFEAFFMFEPHAICHNFMICTLVDH